jgi:hypothetical protein
LLAFILLLAQRKVKLLREHLAHPSLHETGKEREKVSERSSGDEGNEWEV